MLPVAGAIPFGLPAPSLQRPVLSGFAAAALFFAVLAGWSLFAAFSSAVAARGTVLLDSHREAAHATVDPAGPRHRATTTSPRERIARLREELAIERALLDSAQAQRAFIETERAHVERLYDSGYARLPRLLELQLAAGDLEDREKSARGNIARLRRDIAAAARALRAAADERPADAARAALQTLARDAGLSPAAGGRLGLDGSKAD